MRFLLDWKQIKNSIVQVCHLIRQASPATFPIKGKAD